MLRRLFGKKRGASDVLWEKNGSAFNAYQKLGYRNRRAKGGGTPHSKWEKPYFRQLKKSGEGTHPTALQGEGEKNSLSGRPKEI